MAMSISAKWLPSTLRTGTVKLITADDFKTTPAAVFCQSLEVLQTPKFWLFSSSVLPWKAKAPLGGGVASLL